jgi:ribosome-binding factor A
MVVVQGDDAEAERNLRGLLNASSFIRHQLVERLHLRHPPELIFQLDRSQELESRIEELLKRSKKNRLPSCDRRK